MTMPHLMNCGHSETGWCLECVRKLYDSITDDGFDQMNHARVMQSLFPNQMTKHQHHLLCLGLLADIYRARLEYPNHDDAIEEAIASAEQLGLPVSVKQLMDGKPIATNKPEDSFP